MEEKVSRSTSSTTTVYVATPYKTKMAITGKGSALGFWSSPRGKFNLISEFPAHFFLFKGIVPVVSPDSGCNFKFVLLKPGNEDEILEFEGHASLDNQRNQLLPGSLNFFIYQTGNWLENESFCKLEIREQIQIQFCCIIYEQVLKDVRKRNDWDRSQDLLVSCLDKLAKLHPRTEMSITFPKFIDHCLNRSEGVGNDLLLFLIIGAEKLNSFSDNLKHFIIKNASEFAVYLLLENSRIFSETRQKLFALLEAFSIHVGREYWALRDLHFGRAQDKHGLEKCRVLIQIASKVPEVMLYDISAASRLIDFLFGFNEDVDDIYTQLFPIRHANSDCKNLINQALLINIPLHKKSLKNVEDVIRSKFLENLLVDAERRQETLNFLSRLYDRPLAEVVLLSEKTPSHVLEYAKSTINDLIAQKLDLVTVFNAQDYEHFANLERGKFYANFPEAELNILNVLSKMAVDDVRNGSFENIPTPKLLVIALSSIDCVFLLDCASISKLQIVIAPFSVEYLKKFNGAVRKIRNSTLTIQVHFERIQEIIDQVKGQRIPLNDVSCLLAPKMLEYLKSEGLDDEDVSLTRELVNELKLRALMYNGLYQRFGKTPQSNEGLKDMEQYSNREFGSRQVLEPEEWEGYLQCINEEESLITLCDALNSGKPLDDDQASWLNNVKDSRLFFIMWNLNVQCLTQTPLVREELHAFIDRISILWRSLCLDIASRTTKFEGMEEITFLEPNPEALVRFHFRKEPIHDIYDAYVDFKNLRAICNFIGPFVAVLRYFRVDHQIEESIEEMYQFIQNNLTKNWNSTSLEDVHKSGIIKLINEIGIEKPGTLDSIQFIESLVNVEDLSSPLIKCLEETNEHDMETIGRVLQGSLLEACNLLGKLRKRIAPFLQEIHSLQEIIHELHQCHLELSHKGVDANYLTDMSLKITSAFHVAIIPTLESTMTILPKESCSSMQVLLPRTLSSDHRMDRYLTQRDYKGTLKTMLPFRRDLFPIVEFKSSKIPELRWNMSPSEGLEMIQNLIHSVFFVENPKKALTHQQDTVEDGTDVAVEFARCFNSLFAFIERRIESKSNCSGQSGLVIGLVLSTSGLILYVSPQKMAGVPKMATSFIEWNVTNSYPITVIFIQVVHSTVINQLQEKGIAEIEKKGDTYNEDSLTTITGNYNQDGFQRTILGALSDCQNAVDELSHHSIVGT